MISLLALALAAPWIVVPIVTIIRASHSRSLDEVPVDVATDAPRVSIVIPARNEARNIERCVRSALAARYPRLEVIAVDDHSTDETGEILQRLSVEDARVRVVVPPALPSDWFGKQWACATGAAESSGEVIAFFDADTEQSPDLVPRVVNMMRLRDADLLSVAGSQELGTFWERVIQPQIFCMMLTNYGGTESINESRRATGKIANGQCLFVRRTAYQDLGGHGAVRHKVAEDLALAQLYFREGKRSYLVLGRTQLSTRMYTSLRELVEGWGKNIYAGGRDTAPFGKFGRAIYPLMLLSPPLWVLAPPTVLALSVLGVLGPDALLWSSIATTASVAWWVLVYALLGISPLYALLHPLGALMVLYIALRSIVRGSRVQWKERDYVVT